MRIFVAAVVAALPLCGAPALAQSMRDVPLASVAHRLGLTYTYLGSDDAVSLTGHGITVTVRPGEPFFYVNDRSEPVDGGTPTFHAGDVYVPSQFIRQLSVIEHKLGVAPESMRANKASAQSIGLGAMAPTTPRKVATLAMGPVAGSEDVAVSGDATPGSLVSIVLKAIASPLVPTIFLNRSFAIADSNGKFALTLSTAPEYFNGSTFIAEASGVDDVKPVSTSYAPPKR